MDSLNVESATHPYPCQVTMKTVYGEVKFVYMFADGQTVGDVEMLLANYLKDYLPSDVDFKRTMHPVSLEVFFSHGNRFAHMAMNLGR